jgi:hypothetical protein
MVAFLDESLGRVRSLTFFGKAVVNAMSHKSPGAPVWRHVMDH